MRQMIDHRLRIQIPTTLLSSKPADTVLLLIGVCRQQVSTAVPLGEG